MAANPRQANGHRRRELRARVLASESICGICGEPVDKTLTYIEGMHGKNCKDEHCKGCVPHPRRAEVDEIIPVSKGGSPLRRANVQLVHRDCNLRKSNRVLMPDPGPVVTSREW